MGNGGSPGERSGRTYPPRSTLQRLSKKDLRVTQCKICKHGIFEGEPRVWVRGEVTGLIHEGCKPLEFSNEIEDGVDG